MKISAKRKELVYKAIADAITDVRIDLNRRSKLDIYSDDQLSKLPTKVYNKVMMVVESNKKDVANRRIGKLL